MWFSDGLDYPGRDDLLATLQSKGAVEVHQSASNVIGIAPAVYQDGAINLTLRRAIPGPEREAVVQAHGRDPAGNARVLATANASFEAGATEATTSLSLPADQRDLTAGAGRRRGCNCARRCTTSNRRWPRVLT